MDKPLHVVFIMANNLYAPYLNWFARYALQEPRLRMTFIALTATRPKMIEDVGEFGWECHWVRFNDKKRTTDMLRIMPSLYRLLRKLQPDIVQTHLFDDSLTGLTAARLAGIKVRMITKGDTGFHWYYTPKWVMFDKLNNNNATHILALSTESREFIVEKEKAHAEKIYLMPHGIPPFRLGHVEPERQERLRARFNLAGRKVVGMISRYIEWKGFKYLLPAFARLVQEMPEALLLISGYGPADQEADIRALIEANQLQDHVIITGWIDILDVPSLLSIMDVFAHAATMEPFGLVIAEAMFMECPIVSTRTGCASDSILHLETGYLTEPKSIDGLYEGMKYMLAHPEEAKQMGQAAKAYALRELTFDRCFERHMNLWLQATGQ
jgi:glycosyltransferase involved in cell wall biosynthesis